MNEHEHVGPPSVKVRAREIKPYHYALWCRIQDGKPFCNDICGVRWSEDGKKLWFMLESHNFFDAEPDEMVEVVERKGKHCEYLRAKYADWVLPEPPSKPTYEELAAKLASVESTLKLMRTSHEQTRAQDARAAEARIDALVREVERLRAERDKARTAEREASISSTEQAERDRLVALLAAEAEDEHDEHGGDEPSPARGRG